jgi:hypothetical protein
MQKETVDKMLGNYREYSARCLYLECCIRDAEDKLRSIRKTMVPDAISITAKYTDMPGAKGRTSDPTASVASRFADGYMPDAAKELEAELARMQGELRDKTPTVVFVEIWLNALNDKERFVIEKQMIDGLFWREVAAAFNEKFRVRYSAVGLKRIRSGALEKVYKIAE